MNEPSHRTESSNAAALVLAAGGSRRMGEPKGLLPWRGKPLVRHVVQVALDSRCTRVFVVLGGDRKRVGDALADAPVEIVENPDWEEGLASSLRHGIAAVRERTEACDAVVVLLADQPLADAALIDRLLAALEASPDASIATCHYAGTTGPPAVFSRARFDELEALTGDRGAKGLLDRGPDEVLTLPFEDAGLDIDTPDDYANALARTGQPGRTGR